MRSWQQLQYEFKTAEEALPQSHEREIMRAAFEELLQYYLDTLREEESVEPPRDAMACV